MSVATLAGLTALTRIPRGLPSTARTSVSPANPDFAATYADILGNFSAPKTPDRLLTLTIVPPGRMRAEERTSQADAHHLVPCLDLHIGDRGELENPGIVDQRIEPLQLAEESVHRCFVARVVTRRSAEVAAVVAAIRHLPHDRCSDSAGAAGDDGDQPATSPRAAS